MGWRWILVVTGCVVFAGWVHAEELGETAGWQRVDSRYCTIWLEPNLETKKLNQKLKTWMIRPQVARPSADTPDAQLAAKCDTIFRRSQELLDMYPPGVHVTVKITSTRDAIQSVHAARYGIGTEAIAIYVFENNTIYAAAKEFSTSVLAHEMAHCIIDHYFGVRPPRKIEEMLAMYVDAHLGEY